MDIKREPPKKTKRFVIIGVAVVGIAVITLGISRLQPAAPLVEAPWIDSVRIGDMSRDVNAPGSLEPENPRIITAMTSGRVESLPVQPGIMITPSTVLVELSNPDEQIKVLTDEQQLSSAKAQLASLRISLHQQLLSQQGAVASMRTQYQDAVRVMAVNDSLAAKQLASPNDVAKAHDFAAQFKMQYDLEQQRLDDMKSSEEQQLQLAQDQVESLTRILQNQKERVASMTVRAPAAGQLQTLGNPQLELGQYVNAGVEIARITQPGRLKAVLRVPESQANDVSPGQAVSIDLHNNNSVKGHVTRKDPSSQAGTVTVDVALDGKVPPGTSSELAVDGTITIEKLTHVMFMGRPGFGNAESSVGIFKVEPNGKEAKRVTVKLGKASVNVIQVLGGLDVGDKVIISDMSQFDNDSRVRIK